MPEAQQKYWHFPNLFHYLIQRTVIISWQGLINFFWTKATLMLHSTTFMFVLKYLSQYKEKTATQSE